MSRLIIITTILLSLNVSATPPPACEKLINRLDPKFIRKFITACMVKKMRPCISDRCQKDAALDCMELTYKMQLKTFQDARKGLCFSDAQ